MSGAMGETARVFIVSTSGVRNVAWFSDYSARIKTSKKRFTQLRDRLKNPSSVTGW